VEPDGSGHRRRHRARRLAYPRAPPPGRAGRGGGNPGNPGTDGGNPGTDGGNPGTDGTFSGFLTAPSFATPLVSLLIPKPTELPQNWKTFRLSPGLRPGLRPRVYRPRVYPPGLRFVPPGFTPPCDCPP